MTKETMKKIQMFGMRPTPIVLQLAYKSIVKLEGIFEDVIVSVYSWEYPTNFMVLQSKSNLGGYPLILSQPWMSVKEYDRHLWRFYKGTLIISSC